MSAQTQASSRRIPRRAFLQRSAIALGGAAAFLIAGSRADAQTIVNVKSFGALGNDSGNDANAINAALSQVPVGGRVFFPSGTYRLSNSLLPKSNREIEFDSGAKLRFVSDQAHGIMFNNVTNIKTYGMRMRHEATIRNNYNIRVVGSSYIDLFDTLIERNDSVAVTVDESHHILVDGYTNLNALVSNRNIDDAIDIRNSHDVTVRNFDLNTNDDSISPKTLASVGPSETYNILIEDGVIRSRDSGIAFGSEHHRNMHDIHVRNVRFENCGVPLYFKGYNSGYQGECYNITVENVTAEDAVGRCQRAIFFHNTIERAGKMHDISIDGFSFRGPLQFEFANLMRARNIQMRNISCEAIRISNPIRPTSNGLGMLLDGTANSSFSGLSLTGLNKNWRLSGSETKNNQIELESGLVDFVSGAQAESQGWTSPGFRVWVDEISSIRVG